MNLPTQLSIPLSTSIVSSSQLDSAHDYFLCGISPQTLTNDLQQALTSLNTLSQTLISIPISLPYHPSFLSLLQTTILSTIQLLFSTCSYILNQISNFKPCLPPIHLIHNLFQSLSFLTHTYCDILTITATNLRSTHTKLQSHLLYLQSTRIPKLRASRAALSSHQSALLESLTFAATRTATLDKQSNTGIMIDLLQRSPMSTIAQWANTRAEPARMAKEEAQGLREMKKEQRKMYKQAVKQTDECTKRLELLEIRIQDINKILPRLRKAEVLVVSTAVALGRVGEMWNKLDGAMEKGEGKDVEVILEAVDKKDFKEIPKTVIMVVGRFIAHWQAFKNVCEECVEAVMKVKIETEQAEKVGMMLVEEEEGNTLEKEKEKKNEEIDEMTDLNVVVGRLIEVDWSGFDMKTRVDEIHSAMQNLRTFVNEEKHTQP